LVQKPIGIAPMFLLVALSLSTPAGAQIGADGRAEADQTTSMTPSPAATQAGGVFSDFINSTIGQVIMAILGLIISVSVGIGVFCLRRICCRCCYRHKGLAEKDQYGPVILDDADDLAYGLETV
jgi:hypothetical protein